MDGVDSGEESACLVESYFCYSFYFLKNCVVFYQYTAFHCEIKDYCNDGWDG